MKKCFKCGIEKDLSEFYKHPGMADGKLGKCKDCTRHDVRERENVLKSDPGWVEKEKKRCRERNKRLGYAQKHKPTKEQKKRAMNNYREKYPEKVVAKALACGIPTSGGLHNHHWSYRPEHALDVIPIRTAEHYELHRHILYDQERMMYRTRDGKLLDSRAAHMEHIKFLGIII